MAEIKAEPGQLFIKCLERDAAASGIPLSAEALERWRSKCAEPCSGNREQLLAVLPADAGARDPEFTAQFMKILDAPGATVGTLYDMVQTVVDALIMKERERIREEHQRHSDMFDAMVEMRRQHLESQGLI